MGTFSPTKLEVTPSEGALIRAAEEINASLRSRAHLLSIVDGLDLKATPISIRMVYVLAMLNLGFSKSRALARLKVTPQEFWNWKQDEENKTRLDECEARGELILEETLLLAAEDDPKIALAVLAQKDKVKEKIEEREDGRKKNIEDFFLEGLVNRGVVKNGEIVAEKEGPDELK